MAYSAVTQPLPLLRKNCGTESSMVAVQMTRVLPSSIRHEPSAVEMKSGMMFTGRIWSAERLSERKIISQLPVVGCQLSVVGCWLSVNG